MNTRSFSPTRLILFLFGAAAIGLVIWFVIPDALREAHAMAFLILTALLIYAAALLPLVFYLRMTDGTLIGGIIYYRGVAVFGALSAALMLIVLLTMRVKPLIIILELLFVVVFAVYETVSFSVAAHIDNVQRAETMKRDTLDYLRRKAAELQIRTDALDAGDRETRAAVQRLAEDLRFLSPSDQAQAVNLERQIAAKIDSLDLSRDPGPQLKELQTLIRLRKSIY